MKILIIDNGTSYIKKLEKLFKGHEISVVNFDSVSVKQAKQFDLIVLSGGHKYSVLNHQNKYRSELEIIKKANKPILGICLGFELIALNYDCQLKRLRVKEKGIISIELIPDDITKDLKTIKVFENHRWVIKDPGKLISLGSSKDGIEIIKHKTKPIYGLQFHPEMMRSNTTSRKLFSNILKTLKIK